MKRELFQLLYYLVLKHLPSSRLFPRLGSLRAWSVRKFAAEVGKGVNVERGVDIGSGVSIAIGSGSGVGLRCELFGEVTLGCDVMMGPDCLITAVGHKFRSIDVPIRLQGRYDKAIVIGDNVWIGARTVILPGSVIGDGAVIGAGSVVRGDIAARAIVTGNPAQVVGIRGEE